MLSLPRSLLVLTITLAALTSAGRAQVLTADTLSSTAAASQFYVSSGSAMTQTFSDISSIESLTFRMLADTSNTFGVSTVDYYFSEWDSDSSLATGTAIAEGTANVDASSAWLAVTYGSTSYNYSDVSLDLSSVATGLDPAKTYAISFFNASGGSSYGLGRLDTSEYLGGGIFFATGVTSGADLKIQSEINDSPQGLLFSAESLSPVPESGTTAVLFAGMFVMGLVGWRLRQRRQAIRATAIIA